MPLNPIIVVSGLPRSGTSLMMQMLAAGGIELVTDGLRRADDDNPRGYYEDEGIKRLAQDNGQLGLAQGKAIKVISALLYHLPLQWRYKTIFLERDLDEVIRSQNKMLSRLKKAHIPDRDNAVMAAKFSTHLEQIKVWMDRQPNMEALFIPYRTIIQTPEMQAQCIQEFVNRPLNTGKMIQAVDPNLYRNRGSGATHPGS